jgi:hypothetical protein
VIVPCVLTAVAPTMKVEWIEDQQVSACMRCNTSFGLFMRKHHCRWCGLVVCDSCSQGRAVLPRLGYDNKPQRVCSHCFSIICQSRVLENMNTVSGTRDALLESPALTHNGLNAPLSVEPTEWQAFGVALLLKRDSIAASGVRNSSGSIGGGGGAPRISKDLDGNDGSAVSNGSTATQYASITAAHASSTIGPIVVMDSSPESSITSDTLAASPPDPDTPEGASAVSLANETHSPDASVSPSPPTTTTTTVSSASSAVGNHTAGSIIDVSDTMFQSSAVPTMGGRVVSASAGGVTFSLSLDEYEAVTAAVAQPPPPLADDDFQYDIEEDEDMMSIIGISFKKKAPQTPPIGPTPTPPSHGIVHPALSSPHGPSLSSSTLPVVSSPIPLGTHTATPAIGHASMATPAPPPVPVIPHVDAYGFVVSPADPSAYDSGMSSANGGWGTDNRLYDEARRSAPTGYTRTM